MNPHHKDTTADIKKKKITLSGMKQAMKLYGFIKPYKTAYFFGLFFLMGSSLASLAFPKLLGDLVSAGDRGDLAENITKITLLLGVILLIQASFSYFRTILFVKVTERSLADLRQHTYNHLIRLPLEFFNQHRVGELNSRISSDISLLQETLTSTLADFLRQMIIIIGGITLLLFTSPQLTLFMLLIIPAVVLLSVFFGRFIRRYSKQAQQQVAESNTIVEETLQGIQSVKAYTNEDYEAERYGIKTQKIADIGIKGGLYRGAFSAFLIVGMFGALVAVVWKGATLLSAGVIDSGELFSFVLYSGFIAGTIGGLANVFARIQRFLGATEDLFELFTAEKEDTLSAEEPLKTQKLTGVIEFRNLVFSYPSRPDEKVLDKLSLTIQANQKVAIVGASGAGKSTIAALLLRLYEPTSGALLFDNTDSKDFSLETLRSNIGLVPQDIFLFGGTIMENIAYGRPDASEAEVLAAATNANAMEFIQRLPEGMSTLVGERGTQLSGGQRQRIAIARAILKNPAVLILDEATSALDSESEIVVQDALNTLMKGRTSIVIAHRLSTIIDADWIVVLQHGVISEQGTHDMLIKNEDGIYRKLTTLQDISNFSYLPKQKI